MSLKSNPEALSNIYTVEPAASDPFTAPSVAQGGEEFDVAGGWGQIVGEAASFIVSPLNRRTGKALATASQRYAEKIKRQAELEKAIEAAGTDRAGKLQAELDIETRFDIHKVDDGFDVVDVATNTVLAKYTTEAEARKFLVNTQGEAMDLGPQQTRRAEVEEPVSQPGPLPASPEDIPAGQRMGPERDPIDLPGDEAATVGEAAASRQPVKDDPYAQWVSLDDDAINIAAEGIFNRPEAVDGMIGNMRVVGKQGDPKIVDEGHVYGLIESTGAAMKARLDQLGIEEVKRISNQETERLANILGVNPNKLVETLMGGRFNLGVGSQGQIGAIMHATKSLLIAEIRKLDELSKIALGLKGAHLVSDQARYAWVRQNELVANLKRHYLGVRSDIARAQQVNRMPVADARLTVAEQEQMIARNFNRHVDELGGADVVDEAIQNYHALKDDLPARLAYGTQLTRLQKWLDAGHEVFIMNLLSGWFTHVKNMAGGVAVLVGDIGETTGAATLQLPQGAMGRPRSVTYGDVSAKVFGQIMSAREALVAGARSFWLREEPRGMEMTITGETKHNFGPIRQDAFSAQAMELTGFWGEVVDWAGQVLTLGRAPTRMLMAGDTVMKSVAYRGALYEEAYRQARLKNLQGDALGEFIAEFVFNPSVEAATAAKDFGKYVTLQTDMHGTLKHLQKAAGDRFIRLIVPFFKTPTNAVIFNFERSPAAMILKRYQDAQAEGGAAAAKANSRAAIGSALMMYMALEWDKDSFTGNLSSNPGVLAAYRRMGKERNSLRIGDYNYNLKFFEPWSTAPTIVASTMEIVSHPDISDDDAFEILGTVAGALGQSVTNNTFMSGISMLINVMENPDRHGERFAYNYMRAAIPGSSALNEFRRAIDPVRRLKTDYLDVLRARLPGLSEDLPPERNLWGEVQIPHRWRTAHKPNPVDLEVVRLDLNLPGQHPTVIGEIRLLSDEIDWFHKKAGELAYDMIEALINPKSKKAPYVDERNVGMKTWNKWRRDYAESKALSEAGDEIAEEECKSMIRAHLLLAQKITVGELLVHPEFGPNIAKHKRDVEAHVDEQKMRRLLNAGSIGVSE